MIAVRNRARTALATIALTAIPTAVLGGGPEGNNASIFPTACSTNAGLSCTVDSDCPGDGRCDIVTVGPRIKGSIMVIADESPSDNFTTADRPVVTVLLEMRHPPRKRFFAKTFQTLSGSGWPEVGEWFSFDENEFDVPADPNSEDDVHDLTAERSNVPNWKFIRPCFGLKPVGDAILEAAQSMFPGQSFTGLTPIIGKLKQTRSDANAQDSFTADIARTARYTTRISFVSLSTSDPGCSEG